MTALYLYKNMDRCYTGVSTYCTWFGDDLQAELHRAISLHTLVKEAVVRMQLQEIKSRMSSTYTFSYTYAQE